MMDAFTIKRKIKEIERLFDILDYRKSVYPDYPNVLASKNDGKWNFVTIDDYIEKTDSISLALLDMGINPGDRVAIISSSRPEWNMLDMAIMQIGAITVPIYPTITEQDYRYILGHCEAKVAFVEGLSVMNKIEAILPDTPALEHVYTFVNRDRFPYLEQLIKTGKKKKNAVLLKERKDSVSPDSCCTLIYTSGTTGEPKGVMLSHKNIVNQILALKVTPATWSKRALSFLPMCHAYEHTLVLMYQYLGMTVYYAQNLGTIAENIREVCPTMMSAVPRVLERFYDAVYNKGKNLKGLKKKIFYWALKVGREYKIEAEDRSLCYNLKHQLAKKLVLDKIYKGIGGHFDIIVSGAASLQPRLAAFFSAIGMPVYEGYGMTEASPVIATSSKIKHGRAVGTVGPALPGVEVKITGDGEVVCRGHNVMMGYYKAPELTAQTIDAEGWLHTGDLGHFNSLNQLIITGRKKNLFKTSGGKYINPQLIEERFSESPFIENIMVVGENRKFAAALIVPDFKFLKVWCSRHGVNFTNPADMVKSSAILERFMREVTKYNVFFGDTEKVKRFELIADEWSIDNGLLSPTLKMKRAVVASRYASTIEKLFS